jgi:hypothetical protein
MIDYKTHFKNELLILKKQWYILPFFILAEYFHNCSTNLAYYNHIQGPILPDLLFDILPINDNLSFLNEYITYFILFISFIFSILPIFNTNPFKKTYILTIWFRMMMTVGVSVIMRSFSFLSTSLPGPAYHCRINSVNYNPPTGIKDILFTFDTMSGCGDLIFSGHTNIILIQIILIFYYGRSFISRKIMIVIYILMTSLTILILFLIIIARNHYTVDVLIALYITPLLFHFLLYQFPDYKIITEVECDSVELVIIE